EMQSRIVISVSPARARELEERAAKERVELRQLGVVGGDRLVANGLIDVGLEQAAAAWHNGLESALRG
ncbi:MAG: hypothetical protein HQ578_03645, partial [Chloroflexi bacterium]|nr:hypothetical protein [Chloroflexota bacterium]